MKALVTGAAGFIGSHLTQRLIHDGHDVRAFIRYTSRNDIGLLKYLSPDEQDALEIIPGDLRDPHAVHQAVAGVDVVFHLGAIISIPYSYQHPYETAQTNFIGTLNILSACRAHNTQSLVHTSTSEVYGTALRVPMDESHPLQGQSPYSASKIGADALVESFYRSYDLPVVTVRPFNTYGPRQSARAVIPTIITQALTRDQVHLGNLDARRDFTYVADTVDGFLCAAHASGVEGQVYNLGVGHDISIGELANAIINHIGRPVQIVTEQQRQRPQKSEVMRLHSDNTQARTHLDWRPQHTLAEGLSKTIEWIAKNLDDYRPNQYQI